MQGEDLASLKQGAGLKKGVWIAYPSWCPVEPHELLDPMPGLHLAGIHISLGIEGYVMQPVELAGLNSPALQGRWMIQTLSSLSTDWPATCPKIQLSGSGCGQNGSTANCATPSGTCGPDASGG